MKAEEKDLTLENLPTFLTDDQKTVFFDIFWRTWSSNGFGTLTKRDTELLIFSCLSNTFTAQQVPNNNYDWACLLRLTPTKIKTMRLEAHLKFSHLFDSSIQFESHFLDIHAIDVKGLTKEDDIMEVTVSFVVEDPVSQMELEQKLKDIGSYLDFHRNREVVKIRLIDFFRIMAKPDELTLINDWLVTMADKQKRSKEIVERLQATAYASQSEVEKLLQFGDDLADFCQVKKLTDHLKTIYQSQREQPNK